jgi:malate dehydrogenase (oxaloacetate-decarboxylating)
MAHGVREMLVTDPAPPAVERMVGFGARAVDLATLLGEADIIVATSGRPGLIPPSQVRKGQVVLALSNPEPEIDPEAAVAAGAAYASDGRSINNALAFPGLFAGAFAARSRAITQEMLLEAATTLAGLAEPGQLVPSPLNKEIHKAVTSAVAARAREIGLENTARP